MKVATSLLLAGAAAAIAPPQQQAFKFPTQFPQAAKDAWSHQLHKPENIMGTLTDEARAIWDDVARMYPEDMAKASFFSSPKKHTRRLNHEWDHIVRGSDIQNLWIENSQGEKERELDGKLDTYDLRVKKVDPSSLQVDPGVKQYSGYLDDNDNDKHLFYCKVTCLYLPHFADDRRVLRVSKRSRK
jgi:cathepsin A (carboxypeptidase C)